jgi:hypothetical protein
MKDLLQSQKIRAILWILGGVIALLFVFGLGAAVGYRRAVFASRWGENYYHNFYGASPRGLSGNMGGMMRPPFNMHGVAGEVLDVSSSTMSVKDPLGNEESVVVSDDTVIQGAGGAMPFGSVKVGEWVTVIGSPNELGQVQARFIRVFTSSSSLPVNFN